MKHPLTRTRFTDLSLLGVSAITVAPAVLALTLGLAQPARADMTTPNAEPSFSPMEVEMIARNESLRSALKTEPWLVFRAVKILEQPHPSDRGDAFTEPKRQPGSHHNPDLDHLQRIAPEAAQDLFALLKKAGGKNLPK